MSSLNSVKKSVSTAFFYLICEVIVAQNRRHLKVMSNVLCNAATFISVILPVGISFYFLQIVKKYLWVYICYYSCFLSLGSIENNQHGPGDMIAGA